MRAYKVKVDGDKVDLIDIDNHSNLSIMGAPDEFDHDEIVLDKDIVFEECDYIDEQGNFGTAYFAFKKLQSK